MHHDLIIPKEIDSFDVKKRYAVLADIGRTPLSKTKVSVRLWAEKTGALVTFYN